jgi:hypothetical protein
MTNMFWDVEETLINLLLVKVTFFVVLTKATSTAEVKEDQRLSWQVIIE